MSKENSDRKYYGYTKATESDRQLERMVAKAKQHPVDLNKLRKLAGKRESMVKDR